MWKTSSYTKKEINDAGNTIIKAKLTINEKARALEIIDNWRAAHAFPMNTFAVNLKRKAEGIKGALVVQRLKRLDTIVGKLKRYPNMNLYRMQDIGGCRVIVPNINDVYKIVKQFRDSRIRHIESNYKDYIAIPKSSGYRGYHLIYKYQSDKKNDYNGMLIEIQIRTQLQHLWATAVETVGLFTDNALKFSQGSKDWLYFFKLISGLFAIEEKSAVVEGIPNHKFELIEEILTYIKKLDVINKLFTIGAVTQSIGHISKKEIKGYYLIVNNGRERMVSIKVFPGVEKGLEAATKAYNEFEMTKTKEDDAVLVSAQSYESLVFAYPNYFSDIREFTNKIIEINDKVINSSE